MKDIFRRIIGQMLDQYATVLLVLGAVSTLTYMVLITDIRSQEGNARLVKMSTEQGQLIEDINFLLTRKTYVTDEDELRKIDAKIITNMTQLDQSHTSLREGDRFVREGERLVHVPGNLSQDLRLIYFDGAKPLDSQMRDYLSAIREVYRIPANKLELDNNPLLNKIFTQMTPRLLDEIGRTSSIYQRQSESMLGKTANKQHLMYGIALATLALVGLLLLQPLVVKLKESALKMKQEKAFADNVINTTQALIIGVDPNGQVVLFNQYAEENSGWSEAEIKGKDFFDQFIPVDEDSSTLQALFTGMMAGAIEFADAVETSMRISTGDFINIIWNPTVIKDSASGTPVMFLATGLDITERKVAEQKIQQANAELAQLTARLQGEVNLAATLQRSILPMPTIELPGIQGLANLLTSSEVGGDYYDYYKVGGHHSILLIGDVSGHGVAAGTMVGAAKAGVYPLIHEGVTSPSEILNSLNETMRVTAQQSLLMTMACLSLDARNGKLVFANAGHVLPYLLRNQAQHWEMLEASGLPLGKSVDSDYLETAIDLTLEVGDRLFLYTDGLVEEESPSGEAFGYDRLEEILNSNLDADPETLRNIIMDALRRHCRSVAYTDDVTIVVVTHTDRVSQVSASNEVSDIIRISENFYRHGEHPIPRISKEYIVFMAEQGYSDLLTRFSQDGICRILPRHDELCRKLGWEHLLNQHHESPDDDLHTLIPGQSQHRQFQITHTEDKLFIMEEIQSWLTDQGTLSKDHIEALMVILDEMTENSLYAAPRDGKGVAYYRKGESRELSAHEEVRIDIAVTPELLGLMITDNWGTLTPAVFLKNIAHAMEKGVEAGIGGVGLYMMWRLSDYLQIRVFPQKRTQVTTLWDIKSTIDMDVDSGIQFIYHTEYEAAAYPVGV